MKGKLSFKYVWKTERWEFMNSQTSPTSVLRTSLTSEALWPVKYQLFLYIALLSFGKGNFLLHLLLHIYNSMKTTDPNPQWHCSKISYVFTQSLDFTGLTAGTTVGLAWCDERRNIISVGCCIFNCSSRCFNGMLGKFLLTWHSGWTSFICTCSVFTHACCRIDWSD